MKIVEVWGADADLCPYRYFKMIGSKSFSICVNSRPWKASKSTSKTQGRIWFAFNGLGNMQFLLENRFFMMKNAVITMRSFRGALFTTINLGDISMFRLCFIWPCDQVLASTRPHNVYMMRTAPLIVQNPFWGLVKWSKKVDFWRKYAWFWEKMTMSQIWRARSISCDLNGD